MKYKSVPNTNAQLAHWFPASALPTEFSLEKLERSKKAIAHFKRLLSGGAK